jgi:hypothetical protein
MWAGDGKGKERKLNVGYLQAAYQLMSMLQDSFGEQEGESMSDRW